MWKKSSILYLLLIFFVKIQAQQDSIRTDNNRFSTLDTFVTDISTLISDTSKADKDTVQAKKKSNEKKQWSPSPTIASSLSAAVPGLGQIYNKKYWKAPIVYAGLGSAAFLVYYFHKEYAIYRTEYRLRSNPTYDLINGNLINTPNPDLIDINTENIYAYANANRRNMELSIIALSVFYILNIVDAAVDAHLSGFNVTDDLSLLIQPLNHPYSTNNIGLTLHFNF